MIQIKKKLFEKKVNKNKNKKKKYRCKYTRNIKSASVRKLVNDANGKDRQRIF